MHVRTLRRGFTLIELLVVVGIIAVLVAMLMPALQSVRHVSNMTVCLTHLRVLGQAFHSYAAGEDGKFPFDDPLPHSPPPYPNFDCWPVMGMVDIHRLLKPEVSDPSYYLCPADSTPAFTLYWMQTSGASYGFPNPSLVDFESSYYYLFNCYHTFDDPSAANNYPGPAHQFYLRDVRHPSKKAIFICYGGRSGPLVANEFAHGSNSYNLLFADGHAAHVLFADINPADPPDGTGPYNMDWCKGGLMGTDIK